MTRYMATTVALVATAIVALGGDFKVPPYKVSGTLAPQALQAGDVVDWSLTDVGVMDVHAGGHLGKGVRVAVLDTGVAGSHPDLAGQLDFSKDYTGSPVGAKDVNGHGTWCVGRIVAAENGSGMLGVAPLAKVGVFKVLGDTGSGNFDWFNAAVRDATDKGYDVISASLGSSDDPGPSVFDALKYATDRGVLVVLAAGNEGPGANTIGYPAKYAERLPIIVAVAAHDKTGLTASFSSRGAGVVATAGGVETRSTWLDNKFATLNGTSMATPLVAGLGALWCETNAARPRTKARCEAFLKALNESCDGFPTRTTARGYGKPNAVKLLGTTTVTPPAGAVTLTDSDLTPAARAKLTAAGIGAFTITVTPLTPVVVPPVVAPTQQPTAVPQVAAPPGKIWVKKGDVNSPHPWELEDIGAPAPMAMPSQTPVRPVLQFFNSVRPGVLSTCPNGGCR